MVSCQRTLDTNRGKGEIEFLNILEYNYVKRCKKEREHGKNRAGGVYEYVHDIR